MQLWYGGAEANVASAIAQLGGTASLVSTLPDNALGRAARATLAGRGVDTTHLRFVQHGRLGLYFATFGAGIQAQEVLYDRSCSSFSLDAEAPPDVLDDAAYLHITGITPALSGHAAAAALKIASDAVRRGVKLSFDVNYRSSLWSSSRTGDAGAILSEFLALATIAFLDRRDVHLLTNEPYADNELAFAVAFRRFPRLELLATTVREVVSVNHHTLFACAQARAEPMISHAGISVPGIVDRIGSGDAFAGSFLLSLTRNQPLPMALKLALYAAAVKHGQRGDSLTLTEPQLLSLLNAGPGDVRR
jgi:2-dehydro-3-deoxygluconokinase